MDLIFSVFGDVTHTKLGGADTFCDQLNCKYTVFILTIITVLSTAKVFVDEPIFCFCPEKFTDAQVNYANRLCWVKNTHYVSLNETDLPKANDPHKRHITYYQWIPLLLVFQAGLFYLPRMIWRQNSRRCGMVVSHVTDSCIQCNKSLDCEASGKIMNYVTNYMLRFLKEIEEIYRTQRVKKLQWKIYRQAYLCKLYMFIKVIYCVNALSQLFLLDWFLGNDYHFFGVDVIIRLFTSQPWKNSFRFPRVTICDIHIRVLANIHRYSMQCVLPMNLFYEVFFIFLWFWFVIVSITSVYSFLYWAFVILYRPHTLTYIKRCLLAQNKLDPITEKHLPFFVSKFLRKDGSLVVWLVSKNANDIVTSEFILNLWSYYVDAHELKEEKEVKKIGGEFSNPDYKY